MFLYVNIHIKHTSIKPKTLLEDMLAERLSNDITEAYLSVSIEEMLM